MKEAMQCGEFLKFSDYEDMSEVLTTNLRIYGIEKATIQKDGNISFIGNGHPSLWKMVALTGDEVLGDFEGIDDDTKKIAKVLPIEKCQRILAEAFSYEGTIKEIDNDIYYLRTKTFAEPVNTAGATILEEMTYLLPDEVILEIGDYLMQLSELFGAINLSKEIEAKMI